MSIDRNHISQLIQGIQKGSGIDIRVYFIGIGGIGMSAIARYFHSKGATVSGYDKTPTMLTAQLEREGIQIHYTDDINLADKASHIVVYTPAIPKDHEEYNYFLSHGYPVLKRSEVLDLITATAFNICVAGTHGKTTTSTMIAHLLRHSGHGCNAFLGGISANYDTNFWSSDNQVVVVEADEYDRSFLKLHPDIAVITAMDPDHLDIYGDAKSFREAFLTFSKKVKHSGILITKYGLNEGRSFEVSEWMTYSTQSTSADSKVKKINIINGSYHFEASVKGVSLGNFELQMGGMHNIENALAAITVAYKIGIDTEKIREALRAFKGVKRRFEYILRNEDHVLIDDYAHHPQELEALITSVKELYPEKKCTIVFQPHLYSRTKDFADGFAKSLSLADEVILLPIYPARELPIEGVSSELLMQMMDQKKASCCDKERLANLVRQKAESGDIGVFVMAGAGDIDTLIQPVKNILSSSMPNIKYGNA